MHSIKAFYTCALENINHWMHEIAESKVVTESFAAITRAFHEFAACLKSVHASLHSWSWSPVEKCDREKQVEKTDEFVQSIFEGIPPELVENIAAQSELTHHDLLNLTGTCKKFNKMSASILNKRADALNNIFNTLILEDYREESICLHKWLSLRHIVLWLTGVDGASKIHRILEKFPDQSYSASLSLEIMNLGNLTNEVLKNQLFKKFRNVKELTVRAIDEVFPHALNHTVGDISSLLPSCAHLESFSLFSDTHCNLSEICNALPSTLKCLSVIKYEVSDTQLKQIITKFQLLEGLLIRGVADGIQITAQGVMDVSFPPILKELYLIETGIDDEGFNKILRSCRQLIHLNLNNSLAISAAQFVTAEYPQTLNEVMYANTNIDNMGMHHLFSACPRLAEVSLPWCKDITSQGFVEASYPTTLNEIHLTGTSINDEGLLRIARQCPKLRRISINDCPNVTEQGILNAGFAGRAKSRYQ